ncbi:carboxymuconolactone decarboxylase family protein [Nocardia sp. BMG111209]|uniref:carboxymuconolactone decarboxylase family protein n=1 Tax=Nocardia sp. BMG111209 TaxID=1160137 RepID=UPI00037BEBA4|nr:carboxymuconolactone decarboxylase family protein [Nocardia sp. BMG111209]
MVDWLPTAEVRAVAPVLDRYSQSVLLGEVWKRPELSPRDRSLITVSALIARNHLADLSYHIYWALDNGITPAELSETVTHLAFYAGWADALASVPTIKKVFDHRGIGREQLPPVDEELLPQDAGAEARRAAEVERNFGATAPGVVQYTTQLVFGDLWLRPGLAPRDRSLVTVAALVATGHVEQIAFHLERALDAGLTGTEAAETLTHLAFYVGWPNVFAALPVVKEVLAARAR